MEILFIDDQPSGVVESKPTSHTCEAVRQLRFGADTHSTNNEVMASRDPSSRSKFNEVVTPSEAAQAAQTMGEDGYTAITDAVKPVTKATTPPKFQKPSGLYLGF